jgi:hypothetical protein
MSTVIRRICVEIGNAIQWFIDVSLADEVVRRNSARNEVMTPRRQDAQPMGLEAKSHRSVHIPTTFDINR